MYANAVAGDGGVLVRCVTDGLLRGGGKRGEIQGFSKASRRRLIDKLILFPWSQFAETDKHTQQTRCVLLTLTYPRSYPADFRIYKRHLDTFHKALVRARKSGFAAFWRLEFQRRGAPHYHILMAFEERVSVTRLTEWAKRTWFRVVDSGDRRHLEHGADCRAVYQPKAGRGGLVRYLVKYLGKLDNRTGRPGRCWGEWGDLPQVVRAAVVFEYREGFVEFLRRVRRWGKGSPYLRKIHSVKGLRLFGDGTNVLLTLTRGLEGVCQHIV